MNAALPARGECVRWNGSTWRVDHLDTNAVALVDVETGECASLSVDQWLGAVQDRAIERRTRPSALLPGKPRTDAYMRWNEQTWRVMVVRNGIISLQNVATGESGSLPVQRWRIGCLKGTVEMVSSPDAAIPERVRALLSVPMTSMPDKMRQAGERLAPFVEAWRDPHAFYDRHLPSVPMNQRCIPRTLSKAKLQPFFDIVSAAIGVPPPGSARFATS